MTEKQAQALELLSRLLSMRTNTDSHWNKMSKSKSLRRGFQKDQLSYGKQAQYKLGYPNFVYSMHLGSEQDLEVSLR